MDNQKPPADQNNIPEFVPAPNPFQKSTEQPHIDVATPSPLHDGVEMIGTPAQEKPAAQENNGDSKKRRSVFSFVFGGNKKEEAKQAKPDSPSVPEQVLLTWQAPEFVQTHKPFGWYVGIVGFFIILILIAVITRQYITVGLFALMGVVILMYANRPPRVLEYQISNYGVMVGDKKYLFDDFSSYYEISDYGQPLLELVPNKRFGTLVSMPPKPNDVEMVENTLGQMLPKTESKQDYIDKLFRYLRF